MTKVLRNFSQSLSENSATASGLGHYRVLRNLSKSSLACDLAFGRYATRVGSERHPQKHIKIFPQAQQIL
jgi:hypothetical protein